MTVRWRGRSWGAPINAEGERVDGTVPACARCREDIEGDDQAVELSDEWVHIRCAVSFLGGVPMVEHIGQRDGVTVGYELHGMWPLEADQRRLDEVRRRLLLSPVRMLPPADPEPGWPGRCEKCKQPNSYDTGLDGASIWCSNPNCPEAPPEGWEPS